MSNIFCSKHLRKSFLEHKKHPVKKENKTKIKMKTISKQKRVFHPGEKCEHELVMTDIGACVQQTSKIGVGKW